MSRFGGVAGLFARRFFRGFGFDDATVARLRELEQAGAVVYVMRYSSRLDYLLFNWVFLRQGIRLSLYANGIRFFYYRPVHIALRLLAGTLWTRLRHGRAGLRARNLAHVREILELGSSLFLFLRTDKLAALQAKSKAVASAGREVDQLREVVATAFESAVQVSLVPLALFWRKGPKPSRRLIDVLYGAPNRPTTTWKLVSFLWTYTNLAVRVGEPVDLRRFVEERRDDGIERVTRQLRRALLIFLRREEKAVIGATLRSRIRIEEGVLQDPQVQAVIAQTAKDSRTSALKVERTARKLIREVAAHPSPTVMALLDALIDRAFQRVFARIDIYGLDAVVEAAKLHPVILIPSHRSHADYLILSWLLYERHLAPPMVAAGANLSFFPLGPIFRRAGAFFLRRSFGEDPLYTAVFRSYIQLMIKDGVTQEFFIEGTRSRTGKTLPPRTGLLGMILDAFRRGARRDLFVVPVGFTYERLVEEDAITEERRGAEKKPESALGLLRVRRLLNLNFGEVTVRFGAPISLAQRTGLEAKREELELAAGPGREIHDLSRRLGTEICREINGLIVAGRSAVAAAALLGGPTPGTRVSAFARRLREVAELVRLAGQSWSDNLERAIAEQQPMDVVSLLLRSGLVERRLSRRGDILTFSEGSREALVLYRASLLPALSWPALLAGLLVDGRPRHADELIRAASDLLALLRIEFFPPDLSVQAQTFQRVLDHFETRGWITQRAERASPGQAGHWLAHSETSRLESSDVASSVTETSATETAVAQSSATETSATETLATEASVAQSSVKGTSDSETSAPAGLESPAPTLSGSGSSVRGSRPALRRLEMSPAGRGWLHFLAAQLQPTLETYAAVFEAVKDLEGEVSRQALLERAQTSLEEGLLLGEAAYPEALCTTTSANALQLLLDEEVLVAEGNPRRADAQISKGPHAERLDEFRMRLARSMTGR